MDAVNSKKPPKPVKCCEFYGKPPGHLRQKCPAKDATCHKHSKRGHWGFICKSSKTVGLVEEEDYAFLGAIGTETGENTLVGKAHLKQLPCLLQNRHRCSYNSLRPSPTLVKSTKTLFGPAGTAPFTHRHFMGKVEQSGKVTEQEVFVVTGAR